MTLHVRALSVSVVCAIAGVLLDPTGFETVSAQARRTLTHEALWSFERVGPPVPSPDGRWVVTTVNEASYDPQQDVTDLWIVPGDASAPPRRLTSTKGSESGATWSPDGTRLAFAARRDADEVNQLYVIDVARGGEAVRVTNAPTAASAPKWSPDGKSLAFQAAMWNGAKDEESNRRAVQERRSAKSRARIYDTFPVRDWDHWIEESKIHFWIVSVDGDRQARSLLAGTKLAGLAGFGDEALNPAWSPDGQSVLFVASDQRDRAARSGVASSLWQIPVSGGEPTRLSTDGWSVGAPVFRPDGKAVCFPASETKPTIYAIGRIACASWPWAGPIRAVTKELDRAVASFGFAPDSQTIFFSAEDSGHERIYSTPAEGGAVKVVVDAPSGAYSSLQVPPRASAPMLFAIWESAINPPELVRIDPSANATAPQPTFLTSFNTKDAASIDWQPLRDFWFTGRGGRRIHSFIALPPNFDESKKYPLFVLIHGGHESMWRDAITYRWNYHLLAHPGFVVLLTDYRGSTGYGEAFTLSILGDPLAGPADDINDAADEAIKRFPFIDGTRQAAGGASYGGHLTNWLAGTTTRYKALISHAGLASLDMQWGTSDGIYHRELMMGGPYWDNPQKWIEQSPLAKAGRFRTPMLISVGANDYRVPEGNSLTMFAAMQRMNVPSRLISWPDENHWILKGENSRVFYREVRSWLEKYLLPSAATSSGGRD